MTLPAIPYIWNMYITFAMRKQTHFFPLFCSKLIQMIGCQEVMSKYSYPCATVTHLQE